MNIAIILAGGIGARVGAKDKEGKNLPKQFVEVLGKPVIAYTIDVFQNDSTIDAIEVVCVKEFLNYMEEIKNKYSFKKIKWITPGGVNFQESVMNGVNNLNGAAKNDDIVIIHFAASPFVNSEIIDDSIRVAKDKGNAISSTDFYLLPGIKNTTKSVNDETNYSNQYINRDSIACMSTPHSFKYQFVKNLYEEANKTGVINEVEPHTTTLMYKMGKTIYFSKGSQTNIKITTKEDLELFKGFVMAREK